MKRIQLPRAWWVRTGTGGGAVVNQVMKLTVPQNEGNFLTS